jgi:hypothetical protein
MHGDMRARPTPPTLAQLRHTSCWWWVSCENVECLHCAPMALAPVIIPWGPDTSSDVLRRAARCTRCGRKGATLQHPGWAGSDIGPAPFPADRLVAS